jgi:hypothetical protein
MCSTLNRRIIPTVEDDQFAAAGLEAFRFDRLSERRRRLALRKFACFSKVEVL